MDLSDDRVIVAHAQLGPGYKFEMLFRPSVCMKTWISSQRVFSDSLLLCPVLGVCDSL